MQTHFLVIIIPLDPHNFAQILDLIATDRCKFSAFILMPFVLAVIEAVNISSYKFVSFRGSEFRRSDPPMSEGQSKIRKGRVK